MKRILIKLSGEALANKSGELYDADFVNRIADSIKECRDGGYEIALVIGAGNIWRGRAGGEMDRTAADRMGMLATVINSIYFKDALIQKGVKASVMTAVAMEPFADLYSADEAKKRLSLGEVVIFGAGLGIPFLSTDTAGAVRAAEIGADAMFMAKAVDYIYSDDPKKNPLAQKFETITATEVLSRGLAAIDATATAFCLSVKMPIHIFGMKDDPAAIARAVKGESSGTVVIPE